MPDYLEDGTIIEHYCLERVLGGGGFSIVYLATDLRTNEQIVIKEYFPSKLATRDKDMSVIPKDDASEKYFRQGRKLFFQEASILASIDHPNVVKVLGFFQAYDTIYTVMKFERGLSLQAYIKKHGKEQSEKLILSVFIPVLRGLKSVHEIGLLHLDIKPGNIYLRKNNTPVLLDFGAVHKLRLSAGSRLFPVVSHGFSPPEQTRKNASLGPWTDLYAIGASMRACIEAKPPLAAKERVKDGKFEPVSKLYAGKYSSGLLRAIDWAMELEISNRPQSVDEFLKLIYSLHSDLKKAS
ncbi:MAG: serine/threonine-protein kinase [Gammaproteobacteria bacterium]|nr:serine/threonine-protein kinase [Gammaproteobacteria bacterium]